jgi:CheY-like chemotaxis protein
MTELKPHKHIILYADDDIDDLQLVKEAFTQYAKNVEVVTVRDGVEALSYLNNINDGELIPCLIILDINMPKMTGKEALMKLRQQDKFKNIPAMLFTTSSMPLDKDFATKYNAGFITKPIDVRQMEVITDKFINHCTQEVQKHLRRQEKSN